MSIHTFESPSGTDGVPGERRYYRCEDKLQRILEETKIGGEPLASFTVRNSEIFDEAQVQVFPVETEDVPGIAA